MPTARWLQVWQGCSFPFFFQKDVKSNLSTAHFTEIEGEGQSAPSSFRTAGTLRSLPSPASQRLTAAVFIPNTTSIQPPWGPQRCCPAPLALRGREWLPTEHWDPGDKWQGTASAESKEGLSERRGPSGDWEWARCEQLALSRGSWPHHKDKLARRCAHLIRGKDTNPAREPWQRGRCLVLPWPSVHSKTGESNPRQGNLSAVSLAQQFLSNKSH